VMANPEPGEDVLLPTGFSLARGPGFNIFFDLVEFVGMEIVSVSFSYPAFLSHFPKINSSQLRVFRLHSIYISLNGKKPHSHWSGKVNVTT